VVADSSGSSVTGTFAYLDTIDAILDVIIGVIEAVNVLLLTNVMCPQNRRSVYRICQPLSLFISETHQS
jgi:hypothetical protein